MRLWSLASNTSLWHGYDYYKKGKVSSYFPDTGSAAVRVSGAAGHDSGAS
jgi:hypothetical protein